MVSHSYVGGGVEWRETQIICKLDAKKKNVEREGNLEPASAAVRGCVQSALLKPENVKENVVNT